MNLILAMIYNLGQSRLKSLFHAEGTQKNVFLRPPFLCVKFICPKWYIITLIFMELMAE
jgi:hypothetical protein